MNRILHPLTLWIAAAILVPLIPGPARAQNVVTSYSALSGMTEAQMSTAGYVNLISYYSNYPAGGGSFNWESSTSLVPDGGAVVPPSDYSADCTHGCLVRQLPNQVLSPEMFGSYCRGLTADGTADTAGINDALGAMFVNKISAKLYTNGVCALNSSIVINGFNPYTSFIFGGLIEGTSFPTKSSWTTAAPFLEFGTTGTNQIGLDIEVGSATGLDANVIGVSTDGLSGSNIFVGQVLNVNGVVNFSNTAGVSDVNRISGAYWKGGSFGVNLAPGSGTHAEGNFISSWISGFDYGGVISNVGAHYNSYGGQGLEDNGRWTSQIAVSTTSGFNVGDTVTEGTATGTIQAIYPWWNNTLVLQVIEINDVAGGNSNFSIPGTIHDGSNSATITGITTADQVTNPESFDIIENHNSGDAPQDTVVTAYLGGIVGYGLFTNDIEGKNGSTFTTCFRGVGLHTTGGSVELQNCSVNPVATAAIVSPAGIVMGGYASAGPSATTLQGQSVAAGNANTSAPLTTIQGGLSNGAGCGDLALATTNGSAASGAQNTASVGATLKGCTQELMLTPAPGWPAIGITRQPGLASLTGSTELVLDGSNGGSGGLDLNHYATGNVEIAGGGGLILVPTLPTSPPSTHCALWSNAGVITRTTCP